MFGKNIEPNTIPTLDPEKTTLHTLCTCIKQQERISDNMEVELYSQEGYPLNAINYTIERK